MIRAGCVHGEHTLNMSQQKAMRSGLKSRSLVMGSCFHIYRCIFQDFPHEKEAF